MESEAKFTKKKKRELDAIRVYIQLRDPVDELNWLKNTRNNHDRYVRHVSFTFDDDMTPMRWNSNMAFDVFKVN